MCELSPIEECPTGVTNQLLDDGCTMMDVLAQCSEGTSSYDELTACVASRTNKWRRQGLLSLKDVGRITGCAGASKAGSGGTVIGVGARSRTGDSTSPPRRPAANQTASMAIAVTAPPTTRYIGLSGLSTTRPPPRTSVRTRPSRDTATIANQPTVARAQLTHFAGTVRRAL